MQISRLMILIGGKTIQNLSFGGTFILVPRLGMCLNCLGKITLYTVHRCAYNRQIEASLTNKNTTHITETKSPRNPSPVVF